jgi:hypothetical protein
MGREAKVQAGCDAIILVWECVERRRRNNSFPETGSFGGDTSQKRNSHLVSTIQAVLH